MSGKVLKIKWCSPCLCRQAGAQTLSRFDRKEARNLPLLIQFTIVVHERKWKEYR